MAVVGGVARNGGRRRFGAALLAALALGMFSGCGSEDEEKGLGTTVVRLNLPAQAASSEAGAGASSENAPDRTLYPSGMENWTYTVTLAYLGGSPGPAGLFTRPEQTFSSATKQGAAELVLNLEVGVWEFTAHGYTGSGASRKEVARSVSVNGSSTSGAASEVNLTLGPHIVVGETGTLSYSITLPANQDIEGDFTVTDLATGSPVEVTGNPAQFTTEGTKTGSFTLPVGQYLVTATAGGTYGWTTSSEIAHVYSGQTTAFTWQPSGDELEHNSLIIPDDLDLTSYVLTPVAQAQVSGYTKVDAPKYTGTVAWYVASDGSPVVDQFQRFTEFKAVVTLKARPGYNFKGVPQNGWRHDRKDTGVTPNPVNAANSGVVTIWFPAVGGEAPHADVNIILGFNYAEDAITITGDKGDANLIYLGWNPDDILFSAVDDPLNETEYLRWDWTNIQWWIDDLKYSGDGLSNGSKTLLLGSTGLALGTHTVTFVGYRHVSSGGQDYATAYSKVLRVKVNGPVWYAVTESNFLATDTINDVGFNIMTPATGAGRFVAVSKSGRIAYSDNALTWTVGVQSGGSPLNRVAGSPLGSTVSPGILVVGNDGMIKYSELGQATWESRATNGGFGFNTDGSSDILAAYRGAPSSGDPVFLVSGDGGKMAYTTSPWAGSSGVDWAAVTNTSFDSTSAIWGLTYGQSVNRWVAVGDSGRIAYSASAAAGWTQAPGASARADVSFTSVAVSPDTGRFVAAGSGGGVFFSNDGATWTRAVNSTFTGKINALAYGKGADGGEGGFIAVGDNGRMATSVDGGVTWTALDPGTAGVPLKSPFTATEAIKGVAYGAGKIVAVGERGKIAYWTIQ